MTSKVFTAKVPIEGKDLNKTDYKFEAGTHVLFQTIKNEDGITGVVFKVMINGQPSGSDYHLESQLFEKLFKPYSGTSRRREREFRIISGSGDY